MISLKFRRKVISNRLENFTNHTVWASIEIDNSLDGIRIVIDSDEIFIGHEYYLLLLLDLLVVKIIILVS